MATQEKDKVVKPKGAMSAYAYFVHVIREEHKRKHPGEQVMFNAFSKKCAEKWKLMTPKEKKRFEEMANSDKDRYNKEMNNYQPVEEGGRKRRKRRKIKEPGQPKRAWSAFFFFCDEFRPQIRELHPDWRVGNVAKELGRMWEACSDKLKYEKQSAADKQRYEEQMSQYRAGQYVPSANRSHVDSIGGAAVAGSSSTEDPAINPTDSVVNGDDDEEEEFDEEEEGGDVNSSRMSTEQQHNLHLQNKKVVNQINSEETVHESLGDGAISKQLNSDFRNNNSLVEGSSHG